MFDDKKVRSPGALTFEQITYYPIKSAMSVRHLELSRVENLLS
jgi:hypothetical protein